MLRTSCTRIYDAANYRQVAEITSQATYRLQRMQDPQSQGNPISSSSCKHHKYSFSSVMNCGNHVEIFSKKIYSFIKIKLFKVKNIIYIIYKTIVLIYILKALNLYIRITKRILFVKSYPFSCGQRYISRDQL
jgi:hypothetical protein